MTAEYFEARERALLGPRYDSLYAAPGPDAARGVTVSALRMERAAFAAGAAEKPSRKCGRRVENVVWRQFTALY